MKAAKFLIILCCLFPSITSFAQGSKACSPTGVWYGGSDYKYMLTITPLTGDKFTIRYEAVYSNNTFGYTAWTSWPGELHKQKNGRFVGQAISMYTTSSELPPSETSYELDAIRESVEFLDCDNIKSTIFFFGAYLDLSKVPFVDAPDFSYLPPGETITENYHRMPTTCTVCDASTAPALTTRRKP